MDTLLARLTADPLVSNAIIGVVALGVLAWVLGTLRALADGSFKLELLDVWVRSQLLGRIIPIVLILAFSQVVGAVKVGDVEINALSIAGLGSAAAYAATTIQSIVESLNKSAPNPTPKDE